MFQTPHRQRRPRLWFTEPLLIVGILAFGTIAVVSEAHRNSPDIPGMERILTR